MQELPALNYSFTPITEAEKRSTIIDKYVWAIYLFGLIIGLLYSIFNGFKERAYFIAWPAIGLIGSLYNIYERKKRPPAYLVINEETVEWFLPHFTRKEGILWNDLQWVKREKHGIRFYIASSFSRFLPFSSFLWEDQVEIEKIISEEIERRKVKMLAS